jgi:hypothetical protein
MAAEKNSASDGPVDPTTVNIIGFHLNWENVNSLDDVKLILAQAYVGLQFNLDNPEHVERMNELQHRRILKPIESKKSPTP